MDDKSIFNLDQITGTFISPSIVNLINERIYYLIIYSDPKALKDITNERLRSKNIFFLTKKIPKSLNYLVRVYFLVSRDMKVTKKQMKDFYDVLFVSFFNVYPTLFDKLNQRTGNNAQKAQDELIQLCIENDDDNHYEN